MKQNFTNCDLAKDIRCHCVHIGEGVSGFVYKSKKGIYHIFLSESLSPDATSRVLAHEYYHIINHMTPVACFIGLDIQDSPIEVEAKEFEKICYLINKEVPL